MRNRKNLFKLIAFTMMFALILAGCAAGNDGGDTSNGTDNNAGGNEAPGGDTSTGDKTVIKFAGQNDNTPATQAVIDAFNESSEEYAVEWVEMTNDSAQMHDQLLNSLSSGSSEYDVLSLDVVWAGEFADAGYLEAIDVRMREDGLSKDDYNSGSMDSGNYTGKQFTLPFFPDLGLLYFRSDIVSEEDAATLESGDYTYDDLYDMAERYTGEADTNLGFVYQSRQYEGLTVNLTEFSDSYQDVSGGLETMYKFTQADFSPRDLLNYSEGEVHTNFEQGNAVFARNWPYQFGRINSQEDGVTISVDDVGIAPLPNGGSVGGWLLGINNHSENKDGAWEFIKFVSGEEGQKIFSTTGGYLPGYNALLENDEVIASNELLSFPGFKVALEGTIARPVSPDYSQVSDTIQIEAHRYLSSGDNLDQITQAIEEAIAE
ncbi:extracellular solute-binding protein [Bacillus horti]|uniref:Multiple sugar transport system substrate-binding protein n=1 Tax=Caldalkalibacillus horti TaxID=77523 RepID=A0ABT9VVF0_9BACI|nr:extracellular solute-binding protein [Bacillus horti]MDQ0164951.1 multiple sugar transport system substrate-binding protein [Bacillus horti]